MGRCRRALLGTALLAALSADAWAQRTLSWDALDVKARLDADGRLHVTETQVMALSGDWNGGERTFRVGEDQELVLQRLARVDARGTAWPLREGGLSAVDSYAWTDGTTLRWRSRLPSDPPFRDTRLTYVLEYTYSNVLQPDLHGEYVLDHDFAFADRPGVIRRFSLDLALNEAWRPRGTVPTGLVVTDLFPGRTYPVKLALAFAGEGLPAGVDPWRPRVEAGAWSALGIAPVLVLASFWWRERRAGRLEPMPLVSRDWIEENVLTHRPEVIGAAWDEQVGAPEVAAVIARLQGEGKLESEVGAAPRLGSPDITLRLKAPLGDFDGYDGDLLRSLFFDGTGVTSTGAIRAHYRSAGFNPAQAIKADVEKAAEALVARDQVGKPSWLPGFLLFWGGVALIASALLHRRQWSPFWAFAAFGLLVVWSIGHAVAAEWRRRVDRGLLGVVSILVPAAIPPAAAYLYLRLGPAGWRSFLHAGAVAIGLSIFISVFNAARSRRGPLSIRLRKRLCAVRRFFADELRKPAPALDDAWFPYAVAFGLDRQVKRWFGQFGSASGSPDHSPSSTSWGGSSSSSGGSAGWTGGGGAFGGAGATASWAAAVGGLAAGVSSPSSSGSSSGGGGGGGGGGGSSSGGGGGGGW